MKNKSIVPKDEAYARTGIQPLFINTLFQLMAETESNQSCLSESDHLLFTPDLINFWLTGQKGNEITMASTSQMLNQQTRKLGQGVFGQIGYPHRYAGRALGTWSPSGRCDWWGSGKDWMQNLSVFTVGSHDTASAVAGVPALREQDFAYLSSGTWSLMGIELSQSIV